MDIRDKLRAAQLGYGHDLGLFGEASDEIARLRAEIAELHDSNAELGCAANQACAEARELRAELEAARVDAERYRKGWEEMTSEAKLIQRRHLSKHEGDVYHAMQHLAVRFGKAFYGPVIAKLDAAIDAARGGK